MAMRGLSLHVTARKLLRSPSFTLPAFLILTLGIATTTGIFAVVKGVLLDPLPLPESGRIVVVCEEHPEALPWCGVASVATIQDLRTRNSTFEDLGIVRTNAYSIRDGDGNETLDGSLVTPGLLDLLGVQPAMGRLFAPDEMGEARDNVVILSHGLWVRRYGSDPGILGQTIDVEGDVSTVIGVMPEGFEVPGAEWAEFWKPIPWDLTDPEYHSWRGVRAFGRLKPGVSRKQAEADLEGAYQRLGETTDAITPEWHIHARSLLDFVVGPSTRTALLVFLGAVALLLVIGCINVANLLLVRGARRRREFVILHALGARSSDFVGSVLTESFFLAGAAGAAGLGLAWAGLRAFKALAPPFFPRMDNVHLSWGVLVFVVALAAFTALLFGLLPAFRTGREEPAAILRAGRGSTRSGGRGLRRSLVAVELGLSLVLLAAAGVLTRSFMGFLQWEPGFQPQGLIFFQAFSPSDQYSTNQQVVTLWRNVEDRLRALPGVEAVGTASGVPLRSSPEGLRYRLAGEEGKPVEELPAAYFFDVGPGYFATMGMRVARGREFTEADGLDNRPVVAVNQTFARRAWPDEDPLGKTFWTNWTQETVQVVGVIADLDPLTPGESPEPLVYFPNRQKGVRTATMIAVRTRGDPAAQAKRIKDAVLAVEPAMGVYDRGSVDSLLHGQLVRPRFNMFLIGIFALAAAILAALGTYGVLAYVVVERNREFGIRIALGSSRRRILRTVLREGAVLAVIGTVLGIGGAWAGSSLLRGVVYGIEPTDPLTLALASGLLVLLALTACAAPARRASRIDPVVLLKEE